VPEGSLRQPLSGSEHLGAVRLAAPCRQDLGLLELTVGNPPTPRVAVEARQPEVVEHVRAAVRTRQHVIHRARSVAVAEGEAAIPAVVAVALDETSYRTCPAYASSKPSRHALTLPEGWDTRSAGD
jgi:hypothetical protein